MLLDLSHTSHTRALTGIQRVSRSLLRELGRRAEPVCFDPYLGSWRALEDWERSNLAARSSSDSRGARWPLRARLLGRLKRWGSPLKSASAVCPFAQAAVSDGILEPEIFSPGVADHLPLLFRASQGPRVAIFYDAIALRLPALTPPKSVARFPAYLRELLLFDGIAAISEESRQSLLDHWQSIGATRPPPVEAIALGVDPPPAEPALPDGGPATAPLVPVVLYVSSVEGRKNHRALLEACESLWTRGRKFELHLIGIARPETARPALDQIDRLAAAGRPLKFTGAADEGSLSAAYRTAAFTVYPSLMEGFGLPVIESLARGKPCICSGSGALGESAMGGGCLLLESLDAPALETAIDRLLGDPALLARLETEARSRKFKTWSDYCSEVTAWMATLRRHQ